MTITSYLINTSTKKVIVEYQEQTEIVKIRHYILINGEWQHRVSRVHVNKYQE